MSTKQIAIYRRASTGRQVLSLEVQEESCTRLARFLSQGAEPLDYSDPATSSATPIWQRKGGAQMVTAIEAGQVSAVVVAKLDRLGRNARDWHNFCHWLKERNIDLHIADMGGQSQCMSGPAGALMLNMLAAFAEFELEMIRERTQQTADNLFEQRRLVGTLPYGWDALVEGERFSRQSDVKEAIRRTRSKATLVPNHEEQAVIRRMQAMRSRGMGCEAIANALNREGIPTKVGAGTPYRRKGVVVGVTSGEWSYTSVKTVLESRHTTQQATEPAITAEEGGDE